jgi:hypothetical protein
VLVPLVIRYKSMTSTTASKRKRETPTMTTTPIRFHCPACGARIKAPIQLSGRRRNCPRCSHTFIVPSNIPDDAGPILVPQETEDRFVLEVHYRTGAPPGAVPGAHRSRQSA